MKAWTGCAAVVCVVGLGAAAVSAEVTGSTGGSQAFTNLQPALGLNFVIRSQGQFEGLGEIRMLAGGSVPAGYLPTDGQLVPISQNTAMYATIGVAFGGDGKSTFAVPDVRARLPVHAGAGAGLTTKDLGEEAGTEQITLTDANLPPHLHSLAAPANQTGVTGGAQPFSNMQPYLVLNYGVALQGSRTRPLVGEVRAFASSFLPAGWAEANGQFLGIAQNPDLFPVLGTVYGGNGSTTFALPDLRGRTPLGAGTGPGLTPRQLGEKVGTEANTLTNAQMPSHLHTVSAGVDPSGLTGATGAPAPAQPVNDVQPGLGLNYIIATQGLLAGSPTTPPDAPTFVGEVTLYAGPQEPAGWLFADGRVLNINQYLGLFQAIGTTYGGDGATTFALPDLRGRVAMGSGAGADFGLTPRTLAETTGVETVVLTEAELAAHVHTVPEVPEPGPLTAITAGATLAFGTHRRRRSARRI